MCSLSTQSTACNSGSCGPHIVPPAFSLNCMAAQSNRNPMHLPSWQWWWLCHHWALQSTSLCSHGVCVCAHCGEGKIRKITGFHQDFYSFCIPAFVSKVIQSKHKTFIANKQLRSSISRMGLLYLEQWQIFLPDMGNLYWRLNGMCKQTPNYTHAKKSLSLEQVAHNSCQVLLWGWPGKDLTVRHQTQLYIYF